MLDKELKLVSHLVPFLFGGKVGMTSSLVVIETMAFGTFCEKKI
jgi:hypothetical protein